MVQLIMYKTTDGTKFENYEDARKYEEEIEGLLNLKKQREYIRRIMAEKCIYKKMFEDNGHSYHSTHPRTAFVEILINDTVLVEQVIEGLRTGIYKNIIL